MAKHKPTADIIKQGQTIYHISVPGDVALEYRHAIATSYFLYSHNEPLPTKGAAIKKMPVNRVKWYLKTFGNRLFYYSKAKALRQIAHLNGGA